MKKNRLVLILGGARSGKSRFALQLAQRLSTDVCFVATAEPRDEEMQARIVRHRKERPETWHTIEAPRDVGECIVASGINSEVFIIDCLTLLISNLLCDEEGLLSAETRAIAEAAKILEVSGASNSVYIVVSNEVGLGLVPDNPLGRDYRDVLGRVNQTFSAGADEVYFLIAGLPMKIKG